MENESDLELFLDRTPFDTKFLMKKVFLLNWLIFNLDCSES